MENRLPVREDELEKIQVGWNSGMGNYALTSKLLNRINRENFKRIFVLPVYFYRDLSSYSVPKQNRPWNQRHFDIHYRAGTQFILDTITFGRKKIIELLEAESEKKSYAICFKKNVDRKKFQKELGNSKIAISPFGYGEICRRDFEAFLNGCIVMKPDMSHVETWPDYYLPDQTYIPYKWDFSDFTERIDSVLTSSNSPSVAAYGHEMYQRYISSQGGEDFCRRFDQILSEADILRNPPEKKSVPVDSYPKPAGK
jgi:hypothetical protein